MLQKDEFNLLKKFEFIIFQRIVTWINLLSKTEIVGFLEFCNIHSDISSTIVYLKNLAKAAIKSFREDGDLEESLNKLDLTFTKDNLPINLNCGQNSVNKTVNEENSKKSIGTASMSSQLQNLLSELQTSNRVGETSNNSNSIKYIQRLEKPPN